MPSRHSEDYLKRAAKQLPATVRRALRADYERGNALRKMETRFRIHWKTIKAALVMEGVAIRAQGWPAQEKGFTRVLAPFEDRLAKGLAAEAKREAAQIARCKVRCACGGIRAPGVRHQCGA